MAVLEGLKGNKLCQIQEQLLPVRETMEIEDPDGEQLAVLKKGAVSHQYGGSAGPS
ncbi:MAG: hypothetical protein ACOYY3_18425 [Chloroflexota bacterium]